MEYIISDIARYLMISLLVFNLGKLHEKMITQAFPISERIMDIVWMITEADSTARKYLISSSCINTNGRTFHVELVDELVVLKAMCVISRIKQKVDFK